MAAIYKNLYLPVIHALFPLLDLPSMHSSIPTTNTGYIYVSLLA
jgi:hypothetical protein